MAGTRRGRRDTGSTARPTEPEPELAVTAVPRSPDLLTTIESEVIPRLMLAHRPAAPQPACAETRVPPTEEEIYEFARIATCHDLGGALAFVERVCREGLSLETVLLELVAPAARLLGEHWKADLRTFTEVSAGLGTLQQVVHILGPSFAPSLPHRGLVVLSSAPGEQHTLGLYMVGEFLRRAGWGVQVAPAMSEYDLVKLVSSEKVEMLGFSVSNTHLLKPLASMVAAVQKASHNRALKVMVGGSLALDEFASDHGALAYTHEPREAVCWLDEHARGPHRKS